MSCVYVVVEAFCNKSKSYIKVVSSRHPDTTDGYTRAINRSMRMTRNGMPRQYNSIIVTKVHP